MPNIDRIVKHLLGEIADGKELMKAATNASIRNQEILIAQNKHIIDVLERIDNKTSPLRPE